MDIAPDADAVYLEKRQYDVGSLSPQVAVPHNVDNVVSVEDVAGRKSRPGLHWIMHKRQVRRYAGGSRGSWERLFQ